MRLGINPMPDRAWREIDWPAYARRWRELGFIGLIVFVDDPLEATRKDVLAVRAACEQVGLNVAQANGWYECLVNPNEKLRTEGIRGMQALCRIGVQLAADCVYVRPGSLNPNGHWWPHPGNHLPETFDHLVDSLRQISRVAETEGVRLAVEGHVHSVLDTPQRVRDLLDAVASPALKFNVDPVNFTGTVRDAHDTTRVIEALFDTLGPDVIAGHAKDCALRDAFVVHIDEVIIGTGTMNYDLFLRRFLETCPEGFLIIEHLPEDQIPRAREGLSRYAQQLGIPLE